MVYELLDNLSNWLYLVICRISHKPRVGKRWPADNSLVFIIHIYTVDQSGPWVTYSDP